MHLHLSPVATRVQHGKQLRLAPETMRRATRELVKNQWAYERYLLGGRSPVIVPWMPPYVEELVVRELTRVRGEVGLVGEWLLECILYLVVDERDFRRNVRPQWLTLGLGGGRLEIDFWFWKQKVAIEFHGLHHYEYDPRLHSHRQDFVEQRTRDHVKAGLCAKHGIHYVEIPASELSIEYVLNKVRGVLPLRPFPTESAVVFTLEELCLSFVGAVNRRASS